MPVYLLTAEQQYRITASQLQSIEALLEKSEQDRQSWELQAHNLNQRLGESDQKLETSEKRAETLNVQLAREREQYRTLEQSYNRYEASQSEKAAKFMLELETVRLEKERYKGAIVWIVRIILFLIGICIIPCAIKAFRFIQ
jgi:chromosome segregation ATPase